MMMKTPHPQSRAEGATRNPEPGTRNLSTETVTRYVGNCQICEADQKLHDGKMVHHGYKRPGDGYIRGDCPGVHHDPYEISCEMIKAYKLGLERQLANLQASLEELALGKVTHLHETSVDYRNRLIRASYSPFVSPAHVWAEAVNNRIYRIRMEIRGATQEIERCTRRIEGWKLLPLRTIEEEKVKEQAAKAVRATEVARKRAEKAAKIAATKTKQAALETKRQAIRDDFIAKFNALAAQEITETVKRQAFDLARETTKAKYKFMWIHDLGLEDVFVKLGLAEATDEVRGDGRRSVRYGSAFYR